MPHKQLAGGVFTVVSLVKGVMGNRVVSLKYCRARLRQAARSQLGFTKCTETVHDTWNRTLAAIIQESAEIHSK